MDGDEIFAGAQGFHVQHTGDVFRGTGGLALKGGNLFPVQVHPGILIVLNVEHQRTGDCRNHEFFPHPDVG